MRIATVDHYVERLVSRRIFYGWVIVLVTFSTSMTTAGIGGSGISFFVIPMADDLGISRTAFSGISAFRLALLPVVPLLGFVVDMKHGPRLMLVCGSILSGAALILTSRVDNLWEFYIVYGIIFGLATSAMGGMLVGPSVISKWFVRMRCRAMALGTMGISAGGIVIAPLAGWVVGGFGWRPAWVVLGVLLAVMVAPAAAVFMRRSPEDAGMRPDGDPANADPTVGSAQSADGERSLTVRQALRTRTLWIMTLVQSLTFFALSPVLFHQVAYVQDKGFDLATATAVVTTLAFFSMAAKLPWGYLTERVHVRWAMGICMIPTGFSLFLMVGAHSVWMLFVFAAVHGLTMGGFLPIQNVAWTVYFGRKNIGSIRGVVTPLGTIIGAFGPIFAGWAWSAETSYDTPYALLAGAWILAGMLGMATTVPRLPTTAEPGRETGPVAPRTPDAQIAPAVRGCLEAGRAQCYHV